MDSKKGISRRNLLQSAPLAALGLAATGKVKANTKTEKQSEIKIGIGKGQRTGEPYELAGNRMVFMNWYYVRPGSFGYFDKDGKKISLRGSAGLLEAEMRQFDAPYGVRLKAYPAQSKRSDVSISSIVQDGSKYRVWGNGYRVSTDFQNWTEQSTKGGPGTSVFIDPSAPPQQRYKSAALSDATEEEFKAYIKKRPDDFQRLSRDADPGRTHAIFGFVSPDGVNWKKLPVPISIEHSDTNIVAYYDTRLKKYVMYTRNYPLGPRSEKIPYDGFRDQWAVGPRSIGRSETDDFSHFPVSEVILEPTPDMSPTDMLYTSGRTTIPGAPDHHLMFPVIWHRDTDTTSIGFLSSHNGKLWNYVPGSPLFHTPPFGQWNGGCIFTNVNLVELPDGTFALPYHGCNLPHKYPRKLVTSNTGLMLWPKGRLVALEAAGKGAFATVAFVPPGRKLKINAITERVTDIRVEVVAYHDGQPIPGRTFDDCVPVVGDKHWSTVKWKSGDDLGFKKGTAIMLRFKMDKAKIFGLEFVQ